MRNDDKDEADYGVAPSNMQVASDVPDGDHFPRSVLVFCQERPLQYMIFAWSSLALRKLVVHFGLQLPRDRLDV